MSQLITYKGKAHGLSEYFAELARKHQTLEETHNGTRTLKVYCHCCEAIASDLDYERDYLLDETESYE